MSRFNRWHTKGELIVPQIIGLIRHSAIRVGYGWLLAALIPLFAVQVALTTPIEEHAFDAAAFHVWRGVVFSDARAEGILYPRWVRPINGGLGGPLFSFYAPLSYYLMDTLHWLGLPHPLAWRVLVALALMAGSLGMFALGQELFRREDAALAAAACFVYAPPLLRDFFERGAPQGIATALYPALLWAMLRLARHPNGPRLALAAICWTAILLLHNLSAVLLLPIVVIFGLYLVLQSGVRVLIAPIAALVIGTGVAAFHVLPFALESRYIHLDAASQDLTVQPALNPVSIPDLFAGTQWMDTGIDNNTMGTGVGWLQAGAVFLGLAAAIVLWRKNRTTALLLAGISLWGVVLLLMEIEQATPIWRALPVLDILQFRVRLLNAFSLCAALCAGHLFIAPLIQGSFPLTAHPPSLEVPLPEGEGLRVRIFQKTAQWRGYIAAIAIILFVLWQIPMLYPTLQYRYANFPARPTIADAQVWAFQNRTPGLTLTTTKELMPRWRGAEYFTDDEVKRITAVPIANLPNGAKVLEDTRRMASMRVALESPVAFKAALHVMYFPGWQAVVNGIEQPIEPESGSGYSLIDLAAGRSTIDLRYVGTAVQHTSEAISLVVLLVLGAIAIFWRRTLPPTSHPDQEQETRLKARWWIPAGLIVLVVIKAFGLDPQTNLLRQTSQCDQLDGIQVQVNVSFGGNIRLCGYSIQSVDLVPNGAVRVTFYWQLEEPERQPSYSFVHLVGQQFNPATNNPLWGQQDKQTPGTLPTFFWKAGRIYQDRYDFRVAPGLPAGLYRVEVGWTDSAGQRLKPTIHQPVDKNRLSLSEWDSLFILSIEKR